MIPFKSNFLPIWSGSNGRRVQGDSSTVLLESIMFRLGSRTFPTYIGEVKTNHEVAISDQYRYLIISRSKANLILLVHILPQKRVCKFTRSISCEL